MDHSADQLAIRSLVARYCDAVNRYDAVAWAATWAQDGRRRSPLKNRWRIWTRRNTTSALRRPFARGMSATPG